MPEVMQEKIAEKFTRCIVWPILLHYCLCATLDATIPQPRSPLSLLAAIVLFSSLSFLAYGGSCLLAERMRAEFGRYGLSRFRVLTGILEILGAIGLLVGLAVPLLGLMAASGLTLLMLAGVGVRVRIRDSFLQMLPAVFYLLLNGYIAAAFLRIL